MTNRLTVAFYVTIMDLKLVKLEIRMKNVGEYVLERNPELWLVCGLLKDCIKCNECRKLKGPKRCASCGNGYSVSIRRGIRYYLTHTTCFMDDYTKEKGGDEDVEIKGNHYYFGRLELFIAESGIIYYVVLGKDGINLMFGQRDNIPTVVDRGIKKSELVRMKKMIILRDVSSGNGWGRELDGGGTTFNYMSERDFDKLHDKSRRSNEENDIASVVYGHTSYAYENHCWSCHEAISSEHDERCSVCHGYFCSHCGACLCSLE